MIALLQAQPMRPPPPPPEPASLPGVDVLLQQHAGWLYPALAIAVIALLVWGIFRAWRSNDLDGLQKAELKRDLIVALRARPGGLSAEALAREVELDRFQVAQLADELAKEGVLEVFQTTGGLVYHVAGVGGGRQGTRRS